MNSECSSDRHNLPSPIPPASDVAPSLAPPPGADKFQGHGVRERLKRHREEVAGKVTIPENWGKEELLKDWIDCSAFDRIIAAGRIASARASLVAEGRRTSSRPVRVESR